MVTPHFSDPLSRINSAPILSLLTLALALSVVGCGDDGGDVPDAGQRGTDLCVGDADLALTNALVDIPDGGVADAGRSDGLNSQAAKDYLAVDIETCARENRLLHVINQSADLPACMEDCLSVTDSDGISTPCIGCWSDLVGCAILQCAGICSGTDTAGCDVCVNDNYKPSFHQCAGSAPRVAPTLEPVRGGSI